MAYSPIDPKDLARRAGDWLTKDGPDSDVVVSCRVRLARNVAGEPFIARLRPERATELCEYLRESLVEARIDGDTWWVPMTEVPPVMRLLLRERNLISRDLCPEEGQAQELLGRAVAFGSSETVSVMVNEEDHLRLQALAPGFDLDLACQRAQVLDRYLEERVQYSFTEDLGYLTGCPTNVGTGLRASVMLHLPALGLVRRELEKVFTSAQRTGLAVRGMAGEGSRAAGDFYQISNQVTLGRSESNLLGDLKALIPAVIAFERDVRKALLADLGGPLKERVDKSVGLLRSARAMPTDSALAHLSNLRMGLHMGLYSGAALGTLNELSMRVQKGHVQAIFEPAPGNALLDVSERDKLRAAMLRQALANS